MLDIFYALADWFLGLIPAIELPINLAGYLAPMANVFGYIDTFVDLHVITLCISAILIVDNWTLIVRIALKVWDMLPLT